MGKGIKIFAIIVFSMIASNLQAQNTAMLLELEDSIRHYAHLIVNDFNESTQTAANEKLSSFVYKAINQEKSMEHTFDSINNVSFLKSDDKKLRVVTWTLPKRDGSYQFFGYVQTYYKKYKKYIITELEDKTPRLSNVGDKRLTAGKWYGAHYYELIQKRYRRGTTTYTLLGWKGVDMLTKQKVIEVITVKSNGQAVFGYPMFIVKEFKGQISRRPRRVVFTYSARANMHMKYETHRVVEIKKKKANNKTVKDNIGFGAQQKISEEKETKKEKITKMIIFDRLVPSSENMEGIYSYYIPATNVYDGFVFKKGKWIYYQDIDARNSQPAKEKKEINYDLYKTEQNNFFRRFSK